VAHGRDRGLPARERHLALGDQVLGRLLALDALHQLLAAPGEVSVGLLGAPGELEGLCHGDDRHLLGLVLQRLHVEVEADGLGLRLGAAHLLDDEVGGADEGEDGRAVSDGLADLGDQGHEVLLRVVVRVVLAVLPVAFAAAFFAAGRLVLGLAG
jgi:hypothetical protein